MIVHIFGQAGKTHPHINSNYEHRSKFIYQFTNLHLYNTMDVAWFELHYDDPIGHGVDVED